MNWDYDKKDPLNEKQKEELEKFKKKNKISDHQKVKASSER